MRIHAGTLFAGIVFLVTGVAFLFEAAGAWSLGVADLVYVGPLALVAAGAAMLIGALSRSTTDH